MCVLCIIRYRGVCVVMMIDDRLGRFRCGYVNTGILACGCWIVPRVDYWRIRHATI
jgi:hypothetical protein